MRQLLLLTITLAVSFGSAGCRIALPVRLSPDAAGVAGVVAAQRPLVILGGWRDPGILHARLASSMRTEFGEEQVLAIEFFTAKTFAECRQKVIEEIDSRWPSGDPNRTVEVDVIAHSMGGLVARYATIPEGADGFSESHAPTGRALRIANLYTVATPHRGARLAPLAFWDQTARDMVAGSAFLQTLDAQLEHESFRTRAYAIHGDIIVGRRRSMPVDRSSAGPTKTYSVRPLMPSHLNAMNDPRVIDDLIRELRTHSP